MDQNMESDERLVACRKALEAVRKELEECRAALYELRYSDD
jgi:hypothetical protein